ncbi:unnamed protein product [Ilex paraguariensis]|uniref:Uncharacterized protein n=1 Tax=Ilex paraguariensis TaxID=185542 RepID=A0ABC8TCG9_9AQUA
MIDLVDVEDKGDEMKTEVPIPPLATRPFSSKVPPLGHTCASTTIGTHQGSIPQSESHAAYMIDLVDVEDKGDEMKTEVPIPPLATRPFSSKVPPLGHTCASTTIGTHQVHAEVKENCAGFR